MKHRVAGRKLGRTSAHRLALLRNLAISLFRSERITTTLGKAKELRPFAEKLLTLSRRETLHARRQVLRHVRDKEVVRKLFDTLSARYAQRPGGYTRILKLGPRRGDAAEMAIVELVDSEPPAGKKKGAKGGKGAPPAASKGGEAAAPKKEKEKESAKPVKKGEKPKAAPRRSKSKADAAAKAEPRKRTAVSGKKGKKAEESE